MNREIVPMVGRGGSRTVRVMAAVFDLNHHATYVHFHIGSGNPPFFTFSMSLSNILVIAAMLLLFALAIALPFPHHEGAGSQQ